LRAFGSLPDLGGRLTEGTLAADAGASGSALTIRLFQPHDEANVLGLLGSTFGDWPGEVLEGTRSEYFRWKHLESPFGRSLMVVVELDGSIVGFYAYMPWLLCAHGRTVATLRAVDLAIDQRHRRRGISLALRSAMQFSRDVELVWGNPNKVSARGGRRLGRPEVKGLRSFVGPCALLPRTMLTHATRARGRQRPPAPDDTSAASALEDRTLLGRLREPAELQYERFATLKHDDYLRWRYGRWSSYRAVRSDAPGEGALAIFRRRRSGPFVVADVGELLLERRDPRHERRLLRRVAEAAAADFVLCNFSSLRSATLRGMLAYRTKEILMALVLSEQLQLDPTVPDSWALSRGDLELL
jgi:GNAT superfamily N-acetyltransferase